MKKNNFFLCVLGLVIFTSFSVNAQPGQWSSNKSVNWSSSPIANTLANKLFQTVEIPNIELAKTDGIIDESFTNTFVASLGIAESLKDGSHNFYKQQESNDILDSVIYFQTNTNINVRFKVKDYYTFDANGNNLSLLTQYEKDGKWMNASRATFKYDINNNALTIFGELYNETTSDWEDFALIENTYDNNNNNDTFTITGWFDEEKTNWTVLSKSFYTFDDKNRIISEYQEKWQNIEGDIVFEKVVKIDYSYDAKDNDFRKTYFYYDTVEGWKNLVRFSNFYDDVTNFHIRLESEQWNGTDWAYTLIDSETNDENGNVIGSISQRYDVASSTWINLGKTEAEFNADNLRTQAIGYYWDTTITEDDKWVKQGGTFATYDGINMIQYEGKPWNKIFNRYDNSFKLSYVYNSDGYLSTFKSESWISATWKVNNASMWFKHNGERYSYLAEEFTVYYGNKTHLSIDDNSINNFSLSQNYPNPFSSSTTIEYNMVENGFVTLTIFDTTGKQVSRLLNEKQTKGNHKVSFNSNGQLQGGVYYYTLNVNGISQTKKLIIK